MMASNTNCSPNQIKYYVFVALAFFNAISFHASVYNRFGAMEENLNEAAHIKQTMEYDELKAFDYYLKSVQLHRQGINDTLRAFEYAIEAESLGNSISFETEDMKEDALEKKQQAKVDRSTIAGMDLAKQAEEENERSKAMMNRTTEEEAKGKKKLREAQEALESAEAAQNNTKLDKGICKWAPAMCNMVYANNNGGRTQNQTAPATASDAVIKANGDIQDALQVIHEAEQERSEAIELHRNASIHANQSTAILRDVHAFKNRSEADWKKDTKKYRTSAEEEEAVAVAKRDEERAKQEKADITFKEIEMINDTEYSLCLFESVIKDRSNEQHALAKMNSDLVLVRKRQVEWKQKMEEATHHVAKAGWEALVASVAGLCLLVLVGGRIVATFRYQRPHRWILREAPYFSQDLWYLVCHLCIFVLTMGYVGELLMVFHEQTNIARAGITVVFSLSAAVLQVPLLHVLPSVHELFRESRIDATSAIRFLVEHVIRKGAIIALVSAIEMLLCWCWMGTVAFKQVHKLNTFVAWLVVLCMSVGHGIFLRTRGYTVPEYLPTRCGMEFGIISDSTNNVSNDDERNSLLVPSFPGSSQGYIPGAFQGSFVIPSPNASAESSSSMQSVPVGDSECRNDDDYGSLSNSFRASLSASPRNFSWKSELEKIRLLLEFWLASIGLWIVRRDLELIRKLSPLATGIVWGRAPLWILNICFSLVFATLTVSLANMKLGR